MEERRRKIREGLALQETAQPPIWCGLAERYVAHTVETAIATEEDREWQNEEEHVVRLREVERDISRHVANGHDACVRLTLLQNAVAADINALSTLLGSLRCDR